MTDGLDSGVVDLASLGWLLMLALWLAALLLLVRMLTPERAPRLPRGVLLKLMAMVVAGDSFAMLVAAFPLAILPSGNIGRMLMVLVILALASVWNGDCFFRRCALHLTEDPGARRKMSVNFGIGSSPVLLWLGFFTFEWIWAAGPGISRAEFELFSLQLVISPAVILLLCPQDRRGVLLDGLAVLRLLLLAAVGAVAGIEGHIIGDFLGLTMGSALFTAAWGLSAGIIMEFCFREIYAPLLFDDPGQRRLRAIFYGALANPLWPSIGFGLYGMKF